MPLASRVIKIAILIFAVMAVIGSWGYNTNTIWAGLGIGGVAVALAAQKTIENLFGGVAVVSDRPVAIGDFCKLGDRVGTVEDIGLRSTRVRTLDRTLVSVPNSEFSSLVLENFSRRDKVWFHPMLNLRRDAGTALAIPTQASVFFSNLPSEQDHGHPDEVTETPDLPAWGRR